ncbi:dihydrofolate reductase family protein [Yinghuangia sp. YIM S09857]|uniref:dihydrofolate reductase family protein n=1 Tax=Yinghuangia sp. YIM S09857 TaxID=3436929 RepID=UPI003F52991E
MRRLVYYVAQSLDGYIGGPDGDASFLPHDGDHAALAAEYPETVPSHVAEAAGLDTTPRLFDTVLMGKGTYLAGGVPSPYRHLRQIVYSRSLSQAADPGVEIVADDPAAHVRALKAGPGGPGRDLWLCGGGSLAAALRDEIDEFHLKIYPVLVGSGTPLLNGPFAVHGLTLTHSRTYRDGVAFHVYARRPADPAAE